MVDQFNTRYNTQFLSFWKSVVGLKGDVRDLPLEDGSFDVAIDKGI